MPLLTAETVGAYVAGKLAGHAGTLPLDPAAPLAAVEITDVTAATLDPPAVRSGVRIQPQHHLS